MNVVLHSEPPAEVYLISCQATAETLATVVRGYSQRYDPDITKAEVGQFLEDLQNTKLKTPTSFVNMVWLLKNVTRSFEQQLTRYRVGTSFVAESLRFSDKRSAEFYVPQKLTPDQRVAFENACSHSLAQYEHMLAQGAEVQDARGVLPLNICTHMFVSINLQSLSHIYEQRACCQAQGSGGKNDGEWGSILYKMKLLLEGEDYHLSEFLQAPWENPTCVDCSFHASFDRPCKEQHRFNVNLRKLAKERSI